MKAMDDTVPHSSPLGEWLEKPAWKSIVCLICAYGLAVIMLVAGVWKITDPIGTAARVNQALVPAALSLPAALALGISETFAGVLLLVPRFRRWGAWLSGLLLIAFLVYMGVQYDRLVGEECNCFPWIKRAVGPGFIIGDLVFLLMAVGAAVWSSPSRNMRSAALVLAAVCVFSGVSYGVAVTQQTGAEVNYSIEANGKTVPLSQGRVLLYFFDPECSTCLWVAQDMAGFSWTDVQLVAIPTVKPEFASQFMEMAQLKAPLSNDVERLRETFTFGDPPYAVALEDGTVVATMTVFEEGEPRKSLKEAGFIR